MNRQVMRVMWVTAALLALVMCLSPAARAGDVDDALEAPLAMGDHPLSGSDDKSRRRYHRGRSPLSEEQIDEAMTLLEKLHPELAEKLKAHRDGESEMTGDDRQHVGAIIHRHFPRLRYLLHLKETDPPMYELRVEDVRLTLESQRVAKRYTEALREENRQRTRALRDELQTLLSEHFEVRQQLRELELQRLEARIAELRDQIEAREDDRDDVIEQRLRELVGTDEGARW